MRRNTVSRSLNRVCTSTADHDVPLVVIANPEITSSVAVENRRELLQTNSRSSCLSASRARRRSRRCEELPDNPGAAA